MATINFNDKIFTQEALQAFVASLTPLNVFSKSFSDATVRKGQDIAVPRVDALSTTTFSYSNNNDFPYEGSGGTVNTVTVSLDKHQIVSVDITDVQYANSSAAEITAFARQQGKALGKKVLRDIFGIITTSTFGPAVASATIGGLTKSKISSAKTAMVKRDVPTDSLSLVVNPDLFETLRNDEGLSNALNYGGAELIREDRIPTLFGMPVYQSNVLPLNSISLVGFIAHPDSIAVAVRTLEPQDTSSYLAFEVVTDDELGISFTYRRHFNPGRGKHYANFECLYGFTHALTLGLGLIVRTD